MCMIRNPKSVPVDFAVSLYPVRSTQAAGSVDVVPSLNGTKNMEFGERFLAILQSVPLTSQLGVVMARHQHSVGRDQYVTGVLNMNIHKGAASL